VELYRFSQVDSRTVTLQGSRPTAYTRGEVDNFMPHILRHFKSIYW